MNHHFRQLVGWSVGLLYLIFNKRQGREVHFHAFSDYFFFDAFVIQVKKKEHNILFLNSSLVIGITNIKWAVKLIQIHLSYTTSALPKAGTARGRRRRRRSPSATARLRRAGPDRCRCTASLHSLLAS